MSDQQYSTQQYTDDIDKLEKNELTLVRQNLDRFQYGILRGHRNYVETARTNDNFYLGGGLQWNEEDKTFLSSAGRPAHENNGIFPAVNTAIGMQLQGRVDISFKPRGGASDEEIAQTLSKVVMQVCDDIKYQWKETQVFADGMIEQRGYFDYRISFDDTMTGNIETRILDPKDVIPDPDAQDYDPETWQDVIILRWMTFDDIEQLYGHEKAVQVEAMHGTDANYHGDGGVRADADFNDRSHFGDETAGYGTYIDEPLGDKKMRRYLVLDRQHRKLHMENVFATAFGKIYPAKHLNKLQINDLIENHGAEKTRRMVKKIRWTVSTASVLLHDDWSPYDSFTVIPFFPYFRRGRTRGMVDNSRSPQEVHNKAISQFIHILSTSANSGWKVPHNSLKNMTISQLEHYGAKTGLVIEYDAAIGEPQKIMPTPMPTGIDKMIDRTEFAIKTTTGMSDAMQGLNGREISGVAIQSKQYQGQAQLGGPFDNLGFTRNLCAKKMYELIRKFYTEERLIMITDSSGFGNEKYLPIVINEETPEGEIINDLTVGEYDIVISDMPTQATYMDNQFQQAMTMKEKGVNIPDSSIVEMSSLSKKHEIVDMIEQTSVAAPDPVAEAEAKLIDARVELTAAQTRKTLNESVGSSVDAQYSAMQAANVIATTPSTAGMADQLLRSAGYQDQDQPPIVPELPGGGGAQPLPAPQDAPASKTSAADFLAGGGGQVMVPPETGGGGVPGSEEELLPPNTNPTTPVPVPTPETAGMGKTAGIETQRNDGGLRK